MDVSANSTSYGCEITNSEYNADNPNSDQIGVSTNSNEVPIRGNFVLDCWIDSYFYSLGSPVFSFGPGNFSESIKNWEWKFWDEEGQQIDINDYIGKHASVRMLVTIDYDMSLDGISVGQDIRDFGINYTGSDIETHNIMWITWNYPVTVSN